MAEYETTPMKLTWDFGNRIRCEITPAGFSKACITVSRDYNFRERCLDTKAFINWSSIGRQFHDDALSFSTALLKAVSIAELIEGNYQKYTITFPDGNTWDCFANRKSQLVEWLNSENIKYVDIKLKEVK